MLETLQKESANRFCGPWDVRQVADYPGFETHSYRFVATTEVPDGRSAAVRFGVDGAMYAKYPTRAIGFALMEVEMGLKDLIEKHPKRS